MNIELMTKQYQDLTLEQRVNAIEEAKQAAREEAQADNSAAGGIGQLAAGQVDFYSRLVEPAWHQELIDDETNQMWEHDDMSADPRLIAFCKAWEEYQANELKELEEEK